MAESLQLILKSTLFASAKHLSINPDILEYGDENLSAFEICEIRYGVKAINGYRFRLGRVYCVDIKSVTGKLIKIRLVSLYRIRVKVLEDKYKQIIQALFANYFDKISLNFINSFHDKVDFDILGVVFSQEGILLNKNSLPIPWADVGNKNYWRYYSLFSKSNPNNNKSFYYLTDWNTAVLHSVLKHILNTKGLL
jgi:hypothetical protein